MKEYAIYLRKSRADVEAEARGEGETLARHRTALVKLANDRGYHIARIYSEVVSGDTIAARPQMQALLAAVQRGEYAGVICNVGCIYAKAKPRHFGGACLSIN